MGFFGELDGLPPTERWTPVVDTAVRAEEAGFAAIYTNDHLIADAERTDPILECWTTLAALSQHTRRVRLGQLVSASGFRNPALLAKIVATLDVVSGGRAELGIGAGWLGREFDAYGFPFPTAGTRIRQMEEAIRVIRMLWTEDVASFEGEFVRIRDARCDPKPLQAHLPILVGAFGRKSIGVLARHGDRCNFMGTPAQYAKRLGWLAEACAETGRDPGTIDRTWLCNGVLVGATETEVNDVRNQAATAGNREGSLVELSGTPDQIIRILDEYIGLGVREVTLRFADHPSNRSFDLFASKVIPEFA